MSEHWTLWCDDCLVYGPDLRRSGSINFVGHTPRFHPELRSQSATTAPPNSEEAKRAWIAFLAEHGRHKIGLVHE